MGPNLQKTDSELVIIMNHIMTNEIFQAIKLEILRRDQRMNTIQSAPLLGVAAPIQLVFEIYCCVDCMDCVDL